MPSIQTTREATSKTLAITQLPGMLKRNKRLISRSIFSIDNYRQYGLTRKL